eukprot:GHVN01059731.1.p1 GENE.GHVN01059731.1~~GHVN01059731.1.p1  ORF type:complete len:738 (-),score=162.85 GHVN01059731.1:1293-3434(-)
MPPPHSSPPFKPPTYSSSHLSAPTAIVELDYKKFTPPSTSYGQIHSPESYSTHSTSLISLKECLTNIPITEKSETGVPYTGIQPKIMTVRLSECRNLSSLMFGEFGGGESVVMAFTIPSWATVVCALCKRGMSEMRESCRGRFSDVRVLSEVVEGCFIYEKQARKRGCDHMFHIRCLKAFQQGPRAEPICFCRSIWGSTKSRARRLAADYPDPSSPHIIEVMKAITTSCHKMQAMEIQHIQNSIEDDEISLFDHGCSLGVNTVLLNTDSDVVVDMYHLHCCEEKFTSQASSNLRQPISLTSPDQKNKRGASDEQIPVPLTVQLGLVIYFLLSGGQNLSSDISRYGCLDVKSDVIGSLCDRSMLAADLIARLLGDPVAVYPLPPCVSLAGSWLHSAIGERMRRAVVPDEATQYPEVVSHWKHSLREANPPPYPRLEALSSGSTELGESGGGPHSNGQRWCEASTAPPIRVGDLDEVMSLNDIPAARDDGDPASDSLDWDSKPENQDIRDINIIELPVLPASPATQCGCSCHLASHPFNRHNQQQQQASLARKNKADKANKLAHHQQKLRIIEQAFSHPLFWSVGEKLDFVSHVNRQISSEEPDMKAVRDLLDSVTPQRATPSLLSWGVREELLRAYENTMGSAGAAGLLSQDGIKGFLTLICCLRENWSLVAPHLREVPTERDSVLWREVERFTPKFLPLAFAMLDADNRLSPD